MKYLVVHLSKKKEDILVVSAVAFFLGINTLIPFSQIVNWWLLSLFLFVIYAPTVVLLYLALNFVWEFFTLFLANAWRLGVPLSDIYALRYKEGMNDLEIQVIGTDEWFAAIEAVKNKKEE